jgi:hypothetical protein
LLHALALRDLLRIAALDEPLEFARMWDQATEKSVGPWILSTLHFDQHRLAEINAQIDGEAYEPDDPVWDIIQSMRDGAGRDPAVLRTFLEVGHLLSPADDVLGRPGVFDAVNAVRLVVA